MVPRPRSPSHFAAYYAQIFDICPISSACSKIVNVVKMIRIISALWAKIVTVVIYGHLVGTVDKFYYVFALSLRLKVRIENLTILIN